MSMDSSPGLYEFPVWNHEECAKAGFKEEFSSYPGLGKSMPGCRRYIVCAPLYYLSSVCTPDMHQFIICRSYKYSICNRLIIFIHIQLVEFSSTQH